MQPPEIAHNDTAAASIVGSAGADRYEIGCLALCLYRNTSDSYLQHKHGLLSSASPRNGKLKGGERKPEICLRRRHSFICWGKLCYWGGLWYICRGWLR